MVWEFQVLGSLEVRRGGTTVLLGGARQRALLAALLVEAGKVVSLDALTDALWGEHPPADPRNALQTAVARLREALGPDAPIATRSPGYVLEVAGEQVDALRFERLLAEAQRRAGEPAVARRLLDEALGLWRGQAYAEFAEGVARAEALRLSERRLVAVEERAVARLALGEAADVVGELEGAVANAPLRERLVELLMRALAEAGRQREALAVYRRHRDRLVEETGLDPSAALRDLEGRILRGEVARTAGSRTAGARATAPVPRASTSLVGRDAEVAEARDLLARSRVVTITGPGGVGKTRLAVEVAGLLEEAGEEVAWVDLAPLGDPAAVDHVLAAALGVDPSGDRAAAEAVLDVLAYRSPVLVLDNCEHLLDAVAGVVEQATRRSPEVRVLATSRERLAVEGEWVVALGPLPVAPQPGSPAPGGAEPPGAVRLFLERAAAAAGTASAAPAQLPLVAAICAQVDGLPLAVELAAARAATLSLEDLHAALEHDLGAAGQRRGDSPRHRDLWAVADWSHRLLTPDARDLFERLGVFAGTFHVDDAHAVCAGGDEPRAATIGRLAALAEQSLLVVVGDGRYRMLRPLRAFARQRLADRDLLGSVADHHAAVLTARAEEAAGPPLTGEGCRWLEGALDDLREVRNRARLTGDARLLGRLLAALYRFDYWRPGAELMGWADDVLAMAGIDQEPTAPYVYAAAAAAAWRRGDLPAARRLATRGTELGTGPDDPATATAFEAVGDVATFEGRLGEAEAAFGEAARRFGLGDDPDGEVLALGSAALVAAYAGRVAEGIAAADRAADGAQRAGPAAWAFARYAQGECRAERDATAALALLDEAVVLAASCGASFVEGVALLTATTVRGRHGDPVAALPGFAEVIRRWRRSGNWTQQWTTLRNLVELLVRLGADRPALVVAGAAAAERAGAPSFGTESERLERARAVAAARLGSDVAAAAVGRGRRMTADDVVELALDTIEQLSDSSRRTGGHASR